MRRAKRGVAGWDGAGYGVAGMRWIFIDGRSARGGPSGGGRPARGVAVFVAVLCGCGLACGAVESLGWPLLGLGPDGEPVALDGLVGPVRMGLLAAAALLLATWADVSRPRGRPSDRTVMAASTWILFAAAALTAAGVSGLFWEGGAVLNWQSWP